MDDIVQASGLSKGGLYWHFKSKDDILVAILQQWLDQSLLQQTTALAIPAGTTLQKLQNLGQSAIADLQQLSQMPSLCLEFYALAARRPDVRQFTHTYYQHYHNLLSQLLQQGLDNGEFQNIVPSAVATILIAQLEGQLLLWSIAPDLVNLSGQGAEALQLLLLGLQHA